MPVDVVIVFESASIDAEDQSAVESFLASGGRVVFVARSPSKLATGDVDNGDLSSIGAWFAGATSQTGNPFAGVFADVVPSSPGIPMSATLYGRGTEIHKAIAPIAGSAIILTELDDDRSGFFVYRPPSGGRVSALGRFDGGSTEDDVTYNGLAATIIRWAADAP